MTVFNVLPVRRWAIDGWECEWNSIDGSAVSSLSPMEDAGFEAERSSRGEDRCGILPTDSLPALAMDCGCLDMATGYGRSQSTNSGYRRYG